MEIDITCIITGHREGRVAVPSLRSFWEAIDFAERAGYKVQPLLILDRPSDLTLTLFKRFARDPSAVKVLDFGDQGQVRNFAIKDAKGRYTAFLDGDDLWSEDWLVQALEFLKDKPDTHIAHPQFNYFFDKQATTFCQIDQEAPEFRMDLLRLGNYWDALCVCPTRIHREFPFYARDIENGWAFEDWHWNCETLAAGVVHKVVPNSVLFKRRQVDSQNMRAGKNKSRIKRNPLSLYTHPVYAAGMEAE